MKQKENAVKEEEGEEKKKPEPGKRQCMGGTKTGNLLIVPSMLCLFPVFVSCFSLSFSLFQIDLIHLVSSSSPPAKIFRCLSFIDDDRNREKLIWDKSKGFSSRL